MCAPDGAWRDLPSFGVVRDPYARIESCWRDFRYLRRLIHYNFSEFVDWTQSRMGRDDLIMQPSTIEHHVAPMTHAVHGLRFAKTVGRTENLQQDFNLFCEGHGLKSFELPHLRSSQDSDAARDQERSRLHCMREVCGGLSGTRRALR